MHEFYIVNFVQKIIQLLQIIPDSFLLPTYDSYACLNIDFVGKITLLLTFFINYRQGLHLHYKLMCMVFKCEQCTKYA